MMLTDDIRHFVELQRLGFVATVNGDGTPNLSPKGTVRVADDRHLVFVDLGSPQTIANLRERPAVCVNVVDVFLRKGYVFSGQAIVIDEDGPIHEAKNLYADADIPHDRIRRIVKIQVEKVRPLVSPGYDWVASEFDMVRHWTEYWRQVGYQRRFAADTVRVTRTYLEMTERPALKIHMPEDARIERAQLPTLSFYRFLYSTVGHAWRWRDRLKMDDESLYAIIRHPRVEIDVLYMAGVPAGYVEFDTRQADQVEIAYFGLMPEFVGQGLGKKFLQWSVARAWSFEPRRVWLHTCTLDHPSALPLYQRVGFKIVRTEAYLFE